MRDSAGSAKSAPGRRKRGGFFGSPSITGRIRRRSVASEVCAPAVDTESTWVATSAPAASAKRSGGRLRRDTLEIPRSRPPALKALPPALHAPRKPFGIKHLYRYPPRARRRRESAGRRSNGLWLTELKRLWLTSR